MKIKGLEIVIQIKIKGSEIRTPRISRASITRFQSASVILKADHGICLTTRLSRRNVVMGPYNSSADAKKRAIG